MTHEPTPSFQREHYGNIPNQEPFVLTLLQMYEAMANFSSLIPHSPNGEHISEDERKAVITGIAMILPVYYKLCPEYIDSDPAIARLVDQVTDHSRHS